MGTWIYNTAWSFWCWGGFGIATLSLCSLPKMTGRKGRVVSNDDGSISYESRSELDVPVEILNITEKQRFMDGDKVIFEERDCRQMCQMP